MTEPKVGDLVAVYMKAEFSNQQEASRAFGVKLYEVLAIDERVTVLLETQEKDIGKQISDYSRGGGTHRTRVPPVIVLRDIFELVPISQEIIEVCYRGAVITRSSLPTDER
jgi:hypothetical protein